MANTAFNTSAISLLSTKRTYTHSARCSARPPRVVRMVSSAPVKERVTKRQAKPAVKRETKKPPMYRLYIYNDPINRRERVVDVLLKTCQGLSFSRAYAAMQEAHENGRGLVVIVCQEIAEHYCATINGEGILSSIEPDE